ncbi:MAG: DUF3325 domain-containing protein [Phenylobacterium sp.]|nr:DUF3325 domain-containing protein [Phenylobacterium sp.]
MSAAVLFLALLLALVGFAALATAMRRHFHALTGRALSRPTVLALRGVGWALLGSSLWLSMAWLGGPVGFVAWFGLLNAAALGTAFGLTLIKHRLAKSSGLPGRG